MPSSQWRHAIYSEWVFIGYVPCLRCGTNQCTDVAELHSSFGCFCQRALGGTAKKASTSRPRRSCNESTAASRGTILRPNMPSWCKRSRTVTGLLRLVQGYQSPENPHLVWAVWLAAMDWSARDFRYGLLVLRAGTTAETGPGYTSYFFQLAGLKEVFMGTVAVK
jgi:hypothetical protein